MICQECSVNVELALEHADGCSQYVPNPELRAKIEAALEHTNLNMIVEEIVERSEKLLTVTGVVGIESPLVRMAVIEPAIGAAFASTIAVLTEQGVIDREALNKLIGIHNESSD